MTVLYVCLSVEAEEEETNYIKAAARIRHISKKELLRRVIKMSIKDQMFGAILDDIKLEDK